MPKSKKIISIEEVKKIADLARLELTDKEAKTMTEDLANVLGHFSKIQTIDTSNVPEASDVTGMSNISSPDKPEKEKHSTHKTLIGNAPDTKDGQVKVKAVFDQ